MPTGAWRGGSCRRCHNPTRGASERGGLRAWSVPLRLRHRRGDLCHVRFQLRRRRKRRLGRELRLRPRQDRRPSRRLRNAGGRSCDMRAAAAELDSAAQGSHGGRHRDCQGRGAPQPRGDSSPRLRSSGAAAASAGHPRASLGRGRGGQHRSSRGALPAKAGRRGLGSARGRGEGPAAPRAAHLCGQGDGAGQAAPRRAGQHAEAPRDRQGRYARGHRRASRTDRGTGVGGRAQVDGRRLRLHGPPQRSSLPLVLSRGARAPLGQRPAERRHLREGPPALPSMPMNFFFKANAIAMGRAIAHAAGPGGRSRLRGEVRASTAVQCSMLLLRFVQSRHCAPCMPFNALRVIACITTVCLVDRHARRCYI
mmetsp:Transcript_118085/g.328289  ORF Transcript_118085/g.328289 Transcript_118085/m.328289 type:complete len:367 (-) Transcript_118085:8-1108(-)